MDGPPIPASGPASPVAEENRRAPNRAAWERLLRPRSIAIVGASATPGSLGGSVLSNLDQAGFDGDLFLINPTRSEVHGRACLHSPDDLPEGVDCAVLAIPRAGVKDALMACARRRVGAVIAFSGGFAEEGPEGRARQEELAQIAREHGIILEGPNCLGIVNGVDGIPLTFVNTPAERMGSRQGVAIVSQSGAMAAVLSVGLRTHGLGLSFSISTGNEASTGVEDYVEYLIDDGHTRVIAMIVELFRQPRRFLRLAKRAREQGKDIVLLHPGRSRAARASAATHTGAMAGDYEVMRAQVEYAGVVVADTLEELIDISQLLVRCPALPQGGAAVLTESGAFKALALDFCEAVGLPLPALSAKTADRLRQVLPDFIPPTNPLDITAQSLVDPGLFGKTLPPLLDDEQYGSVVLDIILTDEKTSGLKFRPILDALRMIRPSKPVVFAGLDEGAQIDAAYVEELRGLGVPFFPSPERAFRALARLTEFAAKSGQPLAAAPASGSDLRLPAGVLPEYKSKEVLAAVGIPTPRGALARTLDDAQKIAIETGFPVALKAQSAQLSHKSDVGGVVLNVQDPGGLAVAWEQMHEDLARALPELALDGVLVERMGKPGIELIVGGRNDREWGAVTLVGLGGVLAEALQDVRLLPGGLGAGAIARELSRLKGAALLGGFRGFPALDIAAAAEIVAHLGMLMRRAPEIAEVDLNPVVVYPEGQGAVALDALIVTRGAAG